MPVEKGPVRAVDHDLGFDLQRPWLGRAMARDRAADHHLGIAGCAKFIAHQTSAFRERNQGHAHAGKTRAHARVHHAAVPRAPAQRAYQAAWPAPTLLERSHLVQDFVGHGVVRLALVA